MKVFIISDIEGVAGIVKGEQTGPGPHGDATLFDEGRKLYTGEINAAVRGAKAAGATEIVAMDCHGAGGGYTFNSLIPEELDPDCEFVVQDQWTEYTEFPRAGSRRGALRRHARASGNRGRRAQPHRLGPELPEPLVQRHARRRDGINAALCGTWGCPVVLVTGDQAACLEGSELLGDGLTTVQVKRGHGCSERAQPRPVARPRRDRGRREAGSRRPERGHALRPREAVRDQGRVQVDRPGRKASLPPWRRARRRPHDRLSRRRLVDGVEAVLLLRRP